MDTHGGRRCRQQPVAVPASMALASSQARGSGITPYDLTGAAVG
ncbi:hypothetical protein I552_7230 [Mycobacterium xenopi 3993]|nr:hypothetical protein I552_7230 [Mycobacterium xenopi 3993]